MILFQYSDISSRPRVWRLSRVILFKSPSFSGISADFLRPFAFRPFRKIICLQIRILTDHIPQFSFFISAVLSLVPETSSFPTLRNRGKFPNRHLNHKPLLFPSSGPEYCKDLIFSLPFLFCPFCLVSCTSVFLRPNELITQCVIPSFRQTLLHYYLPPKSGVSGPGRFPPGIPPGSLTGASDPIMVIVDDIVNEVSRLSPP